MTYQPTLKTSQEIIKILRSITKVELTMDGDLNVWFEDDPYPSGIRGFIPGSFTRELLEVIADHLQESTL